MYALPVEIVSDPNPAVDGLRYRVYGKAVTGTIQESTEKGKGPQRAISGFLYYTREAGRGWRAVKSYMLEVPYIEGHFVNTQYGPLFCIDESFQGMEFFNWARRPYKRKDGSKNANIVQSHHSSSKIYRRFIEDGLSLYTFDRYVDLNWESHKTEVIGKCN